MIQCTPVPSLADASAPIRSGLLSSHFSLPCTARLAMSTPPSYSPTMPRRDALLPHSRDHHAVAPMSAEVLAQGGIRVSELLPLVPGTKL